MLVDWNEVIVLFPASIDVGFSRFLVPDPVPDPLEVPVFGYEERPQ